MLASIGFALTISLCAAGVLGPFLLRGNLDTDEKSWCNLARKQKSALAQGSSRAERCGQPCEATISWLRLWIGCAVKRSRARLGVPWLRVELVEIVA